MKKVSPAGPAAVLSVAAIPALAQTAAPGPDIPYTLGNTGTHEVRHYLGLGH